MHSLDLMNKAMQYLGKIDTKNGWSIKSALVNFKHLLYLHFLIES